MIFFELDREEIISYGQKHFREKNNRLCKVNSAQMMRKRNNHSRKILFPEYHNRLFPFASRCTFTFPSLHCKKNEVFQYGFLR